MNQLWQDLRYGARMLLKQPGLTLIAALTLALGIGANTAIFSVINALILNPPHIAEAERVAAIWRTAKDKRVEGFVSYLDLQDWRAGNRSFEAIAGYKPNGFILLNEEQAERLQGLRVTANFLSLLKVKPLLGRDFQVEEEKRGAEGVVIISHQFWQNRLGGSDAALGRRLDLNGKPFTVIGVLPPGFEFPLAPKQTELITTIAAEGGNLDERGAKVLRAVGRLQQGVTFTQAQAELTNIAANLERQYPQHNRNVTTYLTPVDEQIVGSEARRALWVLLGAVGFVLLIACVNVTNLLLARAGARRKELALRVALGAGTWRIARHLLTESLLLALLSGGAGLLVAAWGISAIKYYGAEQLPRLDEVQINARALVFTLAVSVLTALLLNVHTGFDPENVLTGRVSLTRAAYQDHEERLRYVNQTLERLRSLPGVESAAFVAPMPFSGGNVSSDFRIEGRPNPEPGQEPDANNRSVTAQYFQAIGIPLLKGRYITEQDRRGGVVGAAIINETLARRYFPNEDPIGKYVSNVGANQNDGDPQRWEIVGVVGDVRHNSLTRPAAPELYLPYQQNSWSWGNFFVRTTNDPATLTRGFTEAIRSGDKTVPVTNVQPLTQAISDTVAQARFYTLLFALFGATGLLLTLTGIYGVISYTVSQQTQEIGVRMALGAQARDVLKLVIGQGLVLTLIGAGLGLLGALGLTQLMQALLFSVSATDPLVFAAVSASLIAVALP